MDFFPPLVSGILLRRYKRFLADVCLDDGEVITAACPNTGSMLGIAAPGTRVYLSRSGNSSRKYPHTWELADVPVQGLIGVNTQHPNRLIEEAIRANTLPGLSGYSTLRREVPYGERSRIDLLLQAEDRPPCYIEAKNVTFYRKRGHAEFPDCATARGTRHLRELAAVVEAGGRAVMAYVIQGGNAQRFSLTPDLDPVYLAAFVDARRRGVEAIALTCHVSTDSIRIDGSLPVSDPE